MNPFWELQFSLKFFIGQLTPMGSKGCWNRQPDQLVCWILTTSHFTVWRRWHGRVVETVDAVVERGCGFECLVSNLLSPPLLVPGWCAQCLVLQVRWRARVLCATGVRVLTSPWQQKNVDHAGRICTNSPHVSNWLVGWVADSVAGGFLKGKVTWISRGKIPNGTIKAGYFKYKL